MNEHIAKEEKTFEEIVYDYRYTFISKDGTLLFVNTKPYFFAVLPFIFSLVLIFSDFPWPVNVFMAFVFWAFIYFLFSKKVIIIDRSNKLLLEITKVFSFKYSKKKYPFHSKVSFYLKKLYMVMMVVLDIKYFSELIIKVSGCWIAVTDNLY